MGRTAAINPARASTGAAIAVTIGLPELEGRFDIRLKHITMEEKYNESTSQRPEGERMIDGQLVSIDLPLFMRQIKEETSWKDGKRNAITVFKTDGLRIVLIALHEGSEMARHIADGVISLQVLEGRIQFNTDQQSIELNNGQMLALHERIPHSVKALQESVFLLTLAISLNT